MNHAQLHTIVVAGRSERWASAGFDAGPDVVVGKTRIVHTAQAEERHGISSVAISGVESESLDGLVLTARPTEPAVRDASHPNGVVSIDHIVATTSDSDRTTAAFAAAGIEPRRTRLIEARAGIRRQTFFWLGDVICELVGPDAPSGDEPAKWWGLALTTESIDRTVEVLGDGVGAPKPAVQPGRTVCTVRDHVGLGVPILFISPHVDTHE